MVKSELIALMTSKFTQLPEKDIELCINQVLEYVSEALAKGERVEIRGFGSFSLHHRPSRNAHNPKTGAKVVTLPKYAPYFKPGKELRDRVNEAKAKGIVIIEEAETK